MLASGQIQLAKDRRLIILPRAGADDLRFDGLPRDFKYDLIASRAVVAGVVQTDRVLARLRDVDGPDGSIIDAAPVAEVLERRLIF